MNEATRALSLVARLQDRAEEWIYRLNERNHPVFRLYDACNELWASLVFRRARRRATRIDAPIEGRSRAARVRFLDAADLDAFAALLGSLDVKYLPPHPRDRVSARHALGRWSYVPLGIFVGDEMIGYVLQRFFFPRRIVSGIWMIASTHNAGLGRLAYREQAKFSDAERLPNYCTIPLDNEPSIRIALWCGFEIIRTNRRFHVLLRRPPRA